MFSNSKNISLNKLKHTYLIIKMHNNAAKVKSLIINYKIHEKIEQGMRNTLTI